MEKGHTFRSHSDTEAIIHQYEEQGPDCLQAMDGMFALGIWDDVRGRMMLARDRMGKKPLYYMLAGGKLLFGSEIKALLAHPDVSRDIDPEALNLYLTFGNVPPPYTLFAGIRKLPAGHRLIADRLGNVKIERYWSPLGETPWPAHADETESVAKVGDLLKSAVRKRLMSDVPIACLLSGGVDSSAIVGLMSALVSRPLQTYSVGFEGFGAEENFNDQPYARLVAKRFGCDHHEVNVTADECRDYLPELVYAQDEPIGDPACLPMHFLCRAARRDGNIVLLVGEGSDEVFGGYPEMARLIQTASQRWNRVRRLPGASTSSAGRATTSRSTGGWTWSSGTRRSRICCARRPGRASSRAVPRERPSTCAASMPSCSPANPTPISCSRCRRWSWPTVFPNCCSCASTSCRCRIRWRREHLFWTTSWSSSGYRFRSR
jgi:asparagine synthase (glutamine-hydrolysing)